MDCHRLQTLISEHWKRYSDHCRGTKNKLRSRYRWWAGISSFKHVITRGSFNQRPEDCINGHKHFYYNSILTKVSDWKSQYRRSSKLRLKVPLVQTDGLIWIPWILPIHSWCETHRNDFATRFWVPHGENKRIWPPQKFKESWWSSRWVLIFYHLYVCYTVYGINR